MAGLTLDSGALIGFERQDRSVVTHLKAALSAGLALTVPAVVLAEVWRGGARSARWLAFSALVTFTALMSLWPEQPARPLAVFVTPTPSMRL